MMRKLTVMMLALIMCLVLVSCGSSGEHVPVQTPSGQTETADVVGDTETQAEEEQDYEALIAPFVGKYLAVEGTADGEDITSVLQSGWEDGSFYEWLEFKEDGEVIFSGYSGYGEGYQEFGSFFFDPVEMRLYGSREFDERDYIPVVVNGDTIEIDADGTYFKFERNDEVPDAEDLAA